MNKEEFIKLFNTLKEYQNMENNIYEASNGAFDLGAMPAAANLFHHCVSFMCDYNDNLIDGLYELIIDGSVSFNNNEVVNTPERFYELAFVEE